ncbi:MAG TPA: YqiA/YcfP family alpha/beta fold hydrolase [Flavobacteriaceae bacterium]|nr:YqiA/YcfP family alpha/beta fold hydrolase [Flavobacteriaceae bacterium]
MNILYLHGLDGRLTAEKQSILEKHGTVHAPEIDYREEENSIESLLNDFKDKSISIVIGSSMGGFVGYYVANGLEVPALLFNPALAYRSVHQEIPKVTKVKSRFKYLVLGANDNLIIPKDTLNFIGASIGKDNYNLHIRQDLAHRIPVDIFEEEVKAFFKILK